MNIEKLYFSDKEIKEKINNSNSINSEGFSCLENIISECKAFIESAQVEEQDTKKGQTRVFSLVIAVRILEISEASLLLMKNAISNEANTMFRVFLDAYFVFANVCSDEEFIPYYLKSDKAARLKLLNSATKHNSMLFNKINEYATAEMKDELKREIKEEQIQPFKSFVYAEKVGCLEIYDSMYRLMSASLHSTPRSIEKYVEEDSNGNISKIKYYPEDGEISQRIYDFSHFLVKVLSGLRETFGILDIEEIKKLTTKVNKIAPR